MAKKKCRGDGGGKKKKGCFVWARGLRIGTATEGGWAPRGGEKKEDSPVGGGKPKRGKKNLGVFVGEGGGKGFPGGGGPKRGSMKGGGFWGGKKKTVGR